MLMIFVNCYEAMPRVGYVNVEHDEMDRRQVAAHRLLKLGQDNGGRHGTPIPSRGWTRTVDNDEPLKHRRLWKILGTVLPIFKSWQAEITNNLTVPFPILFLMTLFFIVKCVEIYIYAFYHTTHLDLWTQSNKKGRIYFKL